VSSSSFVEDTPLYLPSALDVADRSADITRNIATMETILREAQCRTSLEQLRTQLHIKSRLLTYKERQVRYQGANTRARSLIDRNDAKIKVHAAKYRDAREALMKLQGADEVTFGWRKLEDKDIRCMEDPEKLDQDEARREAQREREEMRSTQTEKRKKTKDQMTATGGPGVGEGRRTVSWLFIDSETGEGSMKGVYEGKDTLLCEITITNPPLYLAIRSEWAKAWARTRRWTEEVLLIREEMRRVIAFHYHMALQWVSRQDGAGDTWRAEAEILEATGNGLEVEPVGIAAIAQGPAHSEGVAAYALGQAHLHREMAAHCTKVWAGLSDWEGNSEAVEDDEEEMNLGREEEPSDEEIDQAEGDNQEEGWEGIADDDM
jgi:hypothetical protein